ncbi:MAG: iron-sulfur cluster assembly scaffold protein [Deltaproteobacteria bacterium]|nr:iron-sulfur cluster assembly scaffold protein [Deltaproteobacteria bacterium]
MWNKSNNIIDRLRVQTGKQKVDPLAGYTHPYRITQTLKDKLELPDGYACINGRCGDIMEIYLKFHNGLVEKALFETDGCGSSQACGACAVEMAFGKNPDEVAEVTGETISHRLGGLPEESEHCAFLAAETLQAALEDFMVKQAMKRKRSSELGLNKLISRYETTCKKDPYEAGSMRTVFAETREHPVPAL